MKIKKYDTGDGPPMQNGKYVPHLAVVTDASGEAIMIRPGMVMLEIMDPTDAAGVTPLILVKVTRKGWYFGCACKRKGCSRGLRLRPEWGGQHIFHETQGTRAFEADESEVPSGNETPEK